MARPEKFEDLSEHEQKDNEFLDVRVDYITVDTAVGAAILNLIEACRKSDTFNVSEDGEFKVYLPKTVEERSRALRQAQQSWGYKKEAYESVDTREKPVEGWYRHTVDSWAEGEGLPAIDWAAHDARFEEDSE